jgi:hypothetical protein
VRDHEHVAVGHVRRGGVREERGEIIAALDVGDGSERASGEGHGEEG